MTGFQIQELMKKTTEEFQLKESRYPFELLVLLLLLVVATTFLSYQTVWLRGRMREHEHIDMDIQDDHHNRWRRCNTIFFLTGFFVCFQFVFSVVLSLSYFLVFCWFFGLLGS